MKKYIKPQLHVELIAADTSIASGCDDCPSSVDCVDANRAGTYTTNLGTAAWCNYGNTYYGC